MNYIVHYRKREYSVSAYLVTGDNINPEHYDMVACVVAGDLEDLFRRMNCVDGSDIELVGRGKLEIRSLSVGDVVTEEDSVNGVKGNTYLCAGVGWEKLEGKEFKS